MNPIKQAKQYLTEHEGMLTCVLIAVAVALLLVALFGRTEHKLAAMVYIIF